MTHDMILYKGMELNTELTMTFHFMYEETGQYQTIIRKQNGAMKLRQSFALSISEGYQRGRMFLPANQWFQFRSILSKSVKLIKENLYTIFPSAGKISWDDMDTRSLERFQTEKCLYINGMSIIPIVYQSNNGDSYPGIRIATKNNEMVSIPFEDAIIIDEILQGSDPFVMSLNIMQLIMMMK